MDATRVKISRSAYQQSAKFGVACPVFFPVLHPIGHHEVAPGQIQGVPVRVCDYLARFGPCEPPGQHDGPCLGPGGRNPPCSALR